jgi:hypothetical protein
MPDALREVSPTLHQLRSWHRSQDLPPKKGDRFIFLSEETQTMDNSNNTLPGWDAIVQTMQAVMVLTGAGSAENKSPFTIRVAGQGPGDG